MKVRDLLIVSMLSLVLGVTVLPAQDVKPHPGRRDASTPGLVLETGARTAACDALVFTRDGKQLLAAGDDKVVRSWAVSNLGSLSESEQPTIRWPIFREARGNIYSVALSPDEKLVALAGQGRFSGGFGVAIADRLSGQLLQGSDNPPNAQGGQGGIWAVAFSPSGEQVAIGTELGAVWLWKWKANQFLHIGQHQTPEGLKDWELTVRLVAFAAENEVISVCGNGEIAKWQRDQPLQKQLLHTLSGQTSAPAVLSPDRRWIGVVNEAKPGSSEVQVELISFPDAKQIRRIPYQSNATTTQALPHRLAFNTDSSQLAVGVRLIANTEAEPEITHWQERGGRVDLYDLRAAKLEATPGPKQSLYAESLAFHPMQPHWLAVAGGDHHDVAIWDTRTSEKLGEVTQPGRCIWGVRWSDDEKTIQFQTSRHASPPHPNQRGQGPWRSFDLQTLEWSADQLEGSARLEDTPPAWQVVTFIDDPATRRRRVLQYWKVRTPKGAEWELNLDRALDEFPRCYAFLPSPKKDAVRLIVGHYWGASLFEIDPEQGAKRIRLFRGHEGYVSALTLNKNKTRLLTASRDMTLAGWSLGDWQYHPRFGAELIQRNQRIVIGKVAPGSPSWELGLEEGDELVGFRIANPKNPAQPTVVYDLLGKTAIGDYAAVVQALDQQLLPGQEHLFSWQRPNDPTIYQQLTSFLDRPLWRLFPHGPQEWILWQWRDYNYAASALGDTRVGWQTSYLFATGRTPTFHKAEQFRSEFQKPSAVRQMLQSWESSQSLVEFNKIQPPRVSLSKVISNSGGYEVRINAIAEGSRETQQPERLLVWVNDYLLLDQRITAADTAGLTQTVQIPARVLRQGPNVIGSQCYARNGARGDATPRTFSYEPMKPPPRRLQALLIGINDYSKAEPKQLVNLRAAQDARVIKRALESRRTDGKPFQEIEVSLLVDRQVTRQAILAKLEELRSKSRPDDLFILYLGGHGTTRQKLANLGENRLRGLGRFLFLCHDVNVNRLQDTTISFEDLQASLARWPCHKLILLDSCHSGEAKITNEEADSNPIRVLTQHGVGPAILAASAHDQAAIENNSLDLLGGAYGLFTIALRNILEERGPFQKADRNKDGILTNQELGEAIEVQMKLLMDQHNQLIRGGKPELQTPISFMPTYERLTAVVGK